MATFVATTASNDPALKDADAARSVLDRYLFDGEVQAEIHKDTENGQAYLEIAGYDWPGAWRIPEGVVKDEFEPDYDADPDDGFGNFLREIAPFLAEPLTIQAVGMQNCRFPLSACEWHIRPGATDIEVNCFRHPVDEAGGDAATEDDCPSPDHIV
jgi:hypothetical protein